MDTIKEPSAQRPGSPRPELRGALRVFEKLGIETLRMKLIAVGLVYAAVSISFVSALTHFIFYDELYGPERGGAKLILVPGVLLLALMAALPFLLSAIVSNATGRLARAMELASAEKGEDVSAPGEFEDVAGCFNRVRAESRETAQRLEAANTAEEEQKQILVYIRRALENSSEAITIRDLARDTVYHNRKHLDLYEYSSEELSATNGIAVLSTDPEIPRKVIGALKRGEPWSGEAEMRTRSGRLLRAEIRANPVKDENGEVCGWVSIHRDVTDQRRTERELVRLASFSEQNPNPVIEIDFEGRITYTNRAADKCFPELQTDESAHPALEGVKEIAAALAAERGRSSTEDSLFREVKVADSIYEQKITRAARGEVIRVYMSDITERKRTEGELARLASFPEQNPSPVIEVDFEGRITYMNSAARKRFPEMEGSDLKHPSLEGLEEIVTVLASRGEESFFRHLEVGGSFYEQKITRVEAQPLLQIYMNDITERKRSEEAMARSLEAFLKVATAVSQRDLTGRGEENDDALGEIARLTNKMLDDVEIMLGTVKQLGLSLSSSSMEILASSEQMSRGAHRQTSELTDVSSAVEEMAASMMQVSRNAQASAKAAQEALDMAGHGDEAARNTSEAMSRIDTAVQHTSEKMKTLARRSSEISEIIELINGIAAQTNLLSLNAAIEAAHAGAAGQGFSVVAEEIRKLAEKSARATKEVGTLIKAIQNETAEALLAMEDGMKEVREGRRLSERAGQVIEGMSSMVKQAAELVEEIHVASEEEARVTSNLADAMQTVSSIALETTVGAEQTSQTIQSLVELTEQLNETISHFKVRDSLSDGISYKPVNGGGRSTLAAPSSALK
ncbi:MAG: methyl-accepting chemotaxis protein [Blastocatellia bacterium]|nr:methyl-accepting chemotaxis protein [Blastocatellia bacterium]